MTATMTMRSTLQTMEGLRCSTRHKMTNSLHTSVAFNPWVLLQAESQITHGRERDSADALLAVSMERSSESEGDACNATLCPALNVTSVQSTFVKQLLLRALIAAQNPMGY